MTPSANDWGYRSSLQARGAADRDCPPRGGGQGGSGQGGSGGAGGDGGHDRRGLCDCRCQCDCGGHAGDVPDCGCGCHGPAHKHHGHGCDCGDRHGHGHDYRRGDGKGGGRGRGTTLGWKNPNRPGRQYGWTTGQVPGGQLDPCDFSTPPWNEWPGDRADLYLPFLFMRANAGDLGARPVVGPFWESPDILLLAGADPATAPPVPPELGQTALAGKPNTLYAHVWNFGLAAAPNVVVEFYWCDPTLGIGPAGAHLVGVTMVSLGARGSGRAHAVVKCPQAWFPTFVNGGHECLVVRVWDETSDGLGTPPWDAALNRHVAQRNIHVAAVGEAFRAAAADAGAPLLLPAPLTPLTLKVGPLYGEPAQVRVSRAAPHEMPWLQLRTGTRGLFPAQAVPTGAVLLGSPTSVGGGLGGGGMARQHDVTQDDQQVALTTTDAAPDPGEAHVYRVTASQQGEVFGGYTVVLLG